jgi:hypothetical protein
VRWAEDVNLALRNIALTLVSYHVYPAAWSGRCNLAVLCKPHGDGGIVGPFVCEEARRIIILLLDQIT